MPAPAGAPRSARLTNLLRRSWPAIAVGVVALGVLVRIRQYAGRRSLWLDELSVVLNLASRGFVDLLRPLDYNQTAPVLFLWLEELASRFTGLGELSLRFVPLLCGIAVLPLAWSAARRLLEPWAAACSVLLLAVSPLLVWHANEVKPYAGDALASAGMILLALRTLDAPAEGGRWGWLAAGGVVALLGSTPAAFVLGGVALALALDGRVWRDPAARRRAAGMLTLWGLTFLAVYFAFYRPVAESGFMQGYWDEAFLRIDASLPGTLWHEAMLLLEAAFLPYVDDTALTVAASLGIVLAVIGAVYLARRHGVARAALLVTPLALAVVASLLRRYPLEPRLFLFAVPPLALLLLAGISAFKVRRAPALRLAGFAALFGLSVLSASWRLVKAPVPMEETRTVLEAYRRLANGEPVVVFGHGLKSWVYYTIDWNRVDSTRLRWPQKPATPLVSPWGTEYRGRMPGAGLRPGRGWEVREAERTRLIASPCAWLFFAHYKRPQVDTLIDAIAKVGGSVRREAGAPGAELHRACFEPPVTGSR